MILVNNDIEEIILEYMLWQLILNYLILSKGDFIVIGPRAGAPLSS